MQITDSLHVLNIHLHFCLRTVYNLLQAFSDTLFNEAHAFEEPKLIDSSGSASVLFYFSDISVLPDRNMNYSMLAGQNQSSKSQVITDCPELSNPRYQVKRDAYRQQS